MSGVPILNTPVTLSIAILYLLVCLGIGVWSYGRTKTAADYFITGQTIGLWVVSIAACFRFTWYISSPGADT